MDKSFICFVKIFGMLKIFRYKVTFILLSLVLIDHYALKIVLIFWYFGYD